MKKGMKRVFLVVLCLVMLTAVLPVFSQAANVVLSPQKLRVDGRIVSCEKYNIDGSNYFKLRDLALLLNGSESQFAVDWDAAAQTVSITTGSTYYAMGGELETWNGDQSTTAVPSSQTILINGSNRSDLSVYNIGGNNYFKLRDLGAALGFDVDYDAASNTAVIKSSDDVTDYGASPLGLQTVLPGTWLYTPAGESEPQLTLTLAEDGWLYALRKAPENVDGTVEYIGTWRLENLFAEADDAPDLLILEQTESYDDAYPINGLGDFIVLRITETDNLCAMELQQANNGESVFSVFYDTFMPVLVKAA